MSLFNKRNDEIVEASFIKGEEATHLLNIEAADMGYLKPRKGYNTFGEMVDVLWKINKRAKKMKWSGEFTIKLPLKGVKPIYKKTLEKKGQP